MANIIPLPQNQGINVPPNSGPTYGLANSIDALFDSYQRAKVQNALLPGQVQSQDLANQGAQAALDAGRVQMLIGNNGVPDRALGDALQSFGSVTPGGLYIQQNPGQVAPNSSVSPNQPSPAPQQGQGQAPQMAPGQPTMPQAGPAVQGAPQGQSDPLETVRHAVSNMGEMQIPDMPKPGDAAGVAKYKLAMQHNSAILQMQEAGAKANLTQSEANKNQSDADLNNFFSGGKGGGITASQWAQNARADVASGKKAPSQLYTEASRVGPLGMGKFMVDNALAGLPVAQLEADYAGKTSLATTKNSPAFQVPLTMAKSVLPTMDLMDKIVNQASDSSWQPINKLKLAVASGKGGRSANALTTQAALLTKEINSIIPGGSDAQLDQTIAAINTAKTKAQMQDSMGQLRNYVYNKIGAFGGQPQPSGLNPSMPGLDGAVKHTTQSGISYTVE